MTHHLIQIAKPWVIRRWSEWKRANGKPLVQIQKENEDHVDFTWTEVEQAKLKILLERCTSQHATGAWRVQRCQLAWFALVLGDTADRNDVSEQLYDPCPLNSQVGSAIFQWLRDSYLAQPINVQTQYPRPDKDEVSNMVCLHESKSNESILHCAPAAQ